MMWRSLSVIQGLSSVDRDIEPGPDLAKLTARGSLTVFIAGRVRLAERTSKQPSRLYLKSTQQLFCRIRYNLKSQNIIIR